MNKDFTKEELEILRNHPDVVFASERSIRFSPELKQRAYDWYITGGSMQAFFKENNIDPEMLGSTRIYSFTNNIKNKKLRDHCFEDSRIYNSRHFKDLSDPQSQFECFRTELAYLRQEVEFLKKNLKADMEARKLWESKHRPERNSKLSSRPSDKITTS